MIARNIIQLLFKVLIYLLSYFVVFSHLSVLDQAVCFSYAAAILLLPLSSSPVLVLLFSFFLGIGVDIYHSSLGIHTAACVLIGFLRNSFLNWMVPAGGYEEYMTITIPSMGFKWFLPYMFGLLFLHHTLYFLIDYASLSFFWISLFRGLVSAILTLGVIVLIQFGIEPPNKTV